MQPQLPIDDLESIVSQIGSDWQRLKHAKILITGATGFFGRWMVESFLLAQDRFNLSAEVFLLTRNPKRFREQAPHITQHSSVRLIQGDLAMDKVSLDSLTHVIHMATDTSVQSHQDEPLRLFDTVVQGTRNLLELARQHSVSSFLYVSSGAVYGAQPPSLGAIGEDYTGAPNLGSINSVYGESKRTAELLCQIYNTQARLPVKIARCFAFSGPLLPMDGHYALGSFLKSALQTEEIHVKNVKPLRTYLYASDLAIWLWRILLDGQSGSAYNVGSDEVVSIGTLAHAIAEITGAKVFVPEMVSSQTAPSRYVPSIAKVAEELHLKPTVSLKEGIVKTLNWLQP